MKIIFACIIIGTSHFAACKPEPNPSDKKPPSEISKEAGAPEKNRELLKQYAFCSCLKYAHPDTLIFAKDPSRGVLFELSSYSDDVYKLVDSFAKKTAHEFQPSEIADHGGSTLPFFKCFQFYNSFQLDSLVKEMDNKLAGWEEP
ncbi:MAG: hypothetical protein EOP48_09005 [Sphingobacteriales bacterium]|nr:MAG: hypothetical protein EOP48_09005 [Sphingobacteriales bacterium]